MHICMISDDAGIAGGLQNTVTQISTVLVKNNVKVTVFNSYLTDITSVSQNYALEKISPYNILPPKLRFAHYDRYAYSLKVWRKIQSENSFDLIHGHGDNCFFPALLRNRKPLVVNIHGIKRAAYRRTYGSNSRLLKSPRHFSLFWPEEIAARRSDLVIAVSKAEREELISIYGIDPSKIVVIYNGVDLSNFKPMSKQVARKILGLPENQNYGIWVGNNPSLKGLDIAMKAVRNVENLSLLVVGVSGTSFKNILFYGTVQDRQKMCTLYNAANFLIFPSLYEGFPLVPMEAMACAVPILISKECPTKEIITDGVEGFVIDQRKPEFYREKIKTMLSDFLVNKDTKTNCRQLAEKYCWENVALKYLNLYNHLIG